MANLELFEHYSDSLSKAVHKLLVEEGFSLVGNLYVLEGGGTSYTLVEAVEALVREKRKRGDD